MYFIHPERVCSKRQSPLSSHTHTAPLKVINHGKFLTKKMVVPYLCLFAFNLCSWMKMQQYNSLFSATFSQLIRIGIQIVIFAT